jgi:hypothetical protein
MLQQLRGMQTGRLASKRAVCTVLRPPELVLFVHELSNIGRLARVPRSLRLTHMRHRLAHMRHRLAHMRHRTRKEDRYTLGPRKSRGLRARPLQAARQEQRPVGRHGHAETRVKPDSDLSGELASQPDDPSLK